MRQLRRPFVLAFLLSLPGLVSAQTLDGGAVTGVVRDQSTHSPLEHANVVLLNEDDASKVFRTTTDKDGGFASAHVPAGTYTVECSFIGHKSLRSPRFLLSESHPKMDLPGLALTQSIPALDEVVISSEKNLFNNSIDRKVVAD